MHVYHGVKTSPLYDNLGMYRTTYLFWLNVIKFIHLYRQVLLRQNYLPSTYATYLFNRKNGGHCSNANGGLSSKLLKTNQLYIKLSWLQLCFKKTNISTSYKVSLSELLGLFFLTFQKELLPRAEMQIIALRR